MERLVDSGAAVGVGAAVGGGAALDDADDALPPWLLAPLLDEATVAYRAGVGAAIASAMISGDATLAKPCRVIVERAIVRFRQLTSRDSGQTNVTSRREPGR